jgi:hypothetical protein
VFSPDGIAASLLEELPFPASAGRRGASGSVSCVGPSFGEPLICAARRHSNARKVASSASDKGKDSSGLGAGTSLADSLDGRRPDGISALCQSPEWRRRSRGQRFR